MPYAEGTTVPIEKTRAEIEKLIKAHKAHSVQTEESSRDGTFAVTFDMTTKGVERRVRFRRKLPTEVEAKKNAPRRRDWQTPTGEQQRKWIEGETRRRWRALLLIIKAKLETVASGDVLFDEEFLAQVVGANGLTVYEVILQMEQQTGRPMLSAMPPVK